MELAQATIQPLEFLGLLAHHIRWQIFMALAQSDLRVQELVNLIQQPPNLISYHLKRLRLQRLVTERRSTADGRDIYYSLNIDQFRKMYFETGQALHPAVSHPVDQPQPQAKTSASFPCTCFISMHPQQRSFPNGRRPFTQIRGDQVEVFSAGSEPTSIHPLAIKVMSSLGIDLHQHRVKHLDEFAGQDFDYIVTVCDRVREVCPVFPGDPKKIHWSFPDPGAIEGDLQTQEKGFHDTASQLTTRIKYLLLMIQRNRKEK